MGASKELRCLHCEFRDCKHVWRFATNPQPVHRTFNEKRALIECGALLLLSASFAIADNQTNEPLPITGRPAKSEYVKEPKNLDELLALSSSQLGHPVEK